MKATYRIQTFFFCFWAANKTTYVLRHIQLLGTYNVSFFFTPPPVKIYFYASKIAEISPKLTDTEGFPQGLSIPKFPLSMIKFSKVLCQPFFVHFFIFFTAPSCTVFNFKPKYSSSQTFVSKPTYILRQRAKQIFLYFFFFSVTLYSFIN